MSFLFGSQLNEGSMVDPEFTFYLQCKKEQREVVEEQRRELSTMRALTAKGCFILISWSLCNKGKRCSLKPDNLSPLDLYQPDILTCHLAVSFLIDFLPLLNCQMGFFMESLLDLHCTPPISQKFHLHISSFSVSA